MTIYGNETLIKKSKTLNIHSLRLKRVDNAKRTSLTVMCIVKIVCYWTKKKGILLVASANVSDSFG